MTHPARTTPIPADIAVFISPHRYGHASRACAVMEALLHRSPNLRFLVFTSIPGWFFARLPAASYNRIPVTSDVGMVQTTPLQEDLPATLAALDQFCATLPAAAEDCAQILRSAGVRLALCDISPLGILAAGKAGIPSALVENFTWDWIYAQYAARDPAFGKYARLFAGWYRQASLHIQTDPVCRREEQFPLVPPASRKGVLDVNETRRRLQIPPGKPAALISLGKLLDEFPVVGAASRRTDWTFIIPDSAFDITTTDNMIPLPQDYCIGHMDLAAASDVLIAKSGYSTIAEAYACGTPYGYLNRPGFPESPGLAAFLEREMPAREIPLQAMTDGSWVDLLDDLAALPRRPHPGDDGAAQIADMILSLAP